MTSERMRTRLIFYFFFVSAPLRSHRWTYILFASLTLPQREKQQSNKEKT